MPDIQTLILLLLGATLLLLLLMTVMLVRSGYTHQLENGVQQMQTELVELKVHTQHNQTEARALSDNLLELRNIIRARHDIERQTMDSIRRLEAVIAGTQTKGLAGENIIEAIFAKLPPEWQVRNFRVDNKTVEFGLRLTNGLILPIDSKWAATNLLERFVAAESIEAQQRIKREIERAVLEKAREVRKYLNPNLTTAFGVAVVPDAVYDLCAGIQAEVFHENIVLISYSLFAPYLLMVFQTVLKSGQSVDVQMLEAYLHQVAQNLDALQIELENRHARGLAMLTNASSEMRNQIGQIRAGLHGLQITAEALPEPEDGGRPAGLPESAARMGRQ
jgi:DNA recombination protein RmuC